MLSYQHKASDEAEKQRIIAGGGVVYENFGSWRVSGMLEVTTLFSLTRAVSASFIGRSWRSAACVVRMGRVEATVLLTTDSYSLRLVFPPN